MGELRACLGLLSALPLDAESLRRCDLGKLIKRLTKHRSSKPGADELNAEAKKFVGAEIECPCARIKVNLTAEDFKAAAALEKIDSGARPGLDGEEALISAPLPSVVLETQATMARLRELLPEVFEGRPASSIGDGDSAEDGGSSLLQDSEPGAKAVSPERPSKVAEPVLSEIDAVKAVSSSHSATPSAPALKEGGKVPSFVPFSATAASKAIPWKAPAPASAAAAKPTTIFARGYREEPYRVINEPVSASCCLCGAEVTFPSQGDRLCPRRVPCVQLA